MKSAEHHADLILRASGTKLRYYTLPQQRAELLGAVRLAQAEAYAAGQEAMRHAALMAQPCTAENPHESQDAMAYLSGVVDYGKEIRNLPIQPLPESKTDEQA